MKKIVVVSLVGCLLGANQLFGSTYAEFVKALAKKPTNSNELVALYNGLPGRDKSAADRAASRAGVNIKSLVAAAPVTAPTAPARVVTPPLPSEPRWKYLIRALNGAPTQALVEEAKRLQTKVPSTDRAAFDKAIAEAESNLTPPPSELDESEPQAPTQEQWNKEARDLMATLPRADASEVTDLADYLGRHRADLSANVVTEFEAALNTARARLAAPAAEVKKAEDAAKAAATATAAAAAAKVEAGVKASKEEAAKATAAWGSKTFDDLSDTMNDADAFALLTPYDKAAIAARITTLKTTASAAEQTSLNAWLPRLS